MCQEPNDYTQGEYWDSGPDEYIEDSYVPVRGEWEEFVEGNNEFLEFMENLDWLKQEGQENQEAQEDWNFEERKEIDVYMKEPDRTWEEKRRRQSEEDKRQEFPNSEQKIEKKNRECINESVGKEEHLDEAHATQMTKGRKLGQNILEGQGKLEKETQKLNIGKDQQQVKDQVLWGENSQDTQTSLEEGKYSGDYNWLETIFYTKHKLEPIKEEAEEQKSNLDHLVDLIDSTEVEGKELGEENIGFKMLKEMGWSQGRGIGKNEQGRPFPVHITQKNDRRGLGAQGNLEPGKDKQKVEWVLGTESLNYIKGDYLYDNKRVLSYFIDLKIQGVSIRALVDTGASVSVLTTSVLRKCPGLKIQETQSEIKGIGNICLKVGGTVNTEVVLGNRKYEKESFVILNATELPVEAVLGLSFLKKNNIILDLGNEELRTKEGHIIKLIPKFRKQIAKATEVFLAEETIIPAFSRKYMLGEVGNKIWEGEEVVFYMKEEEKELEAQGCLLGKCVNEIQQGNILIPVINFTREDLNFRRGQFLGRICSLAPRTHNDEVEEGFLWAEWDRNNTKENLTENVSHLYDLDHITDGKKEIIDLLEKYKNVTSVSEYDIGFCSIPAMDIETDHPPICIPPRRMSPHIKSKVREQIKEMHKAGIIEPSRSAWSFPLVPVMKRDGQVRPCADLRELNRVSRFEAHPLPQIHETLSSLKGAKYFTSIDLMKGFNQLFLTERASDICSFPFDGMLWKYIRIPFGLKQSPGFFQLQMMTVLQGLVPEEVLIYLDDFLLISTSLEQHLVLFEKVLQRLEKYGLKIKPLKCEILKTQVKFLGHRISGEGISQLEESVQAIKNFKVPKTCRELKRFIGVCNWYRPFVPHFGEIVKPLTEGMSKLTLKWTPECEKAFNTIKECFISSRVLAYPDYKSSEPLIITSDASASGVGGFLSQVQNGQERVIGYFSKCFNECQSKMSAFDKELEGVRLNVKHFKPHLMGKQVIIRTDHKPIIELAKQKHLNSRLFRIYELLDTLDLTIEYIPGKDNVISDALSRNFEGQIPIEKDPVILPNGLEEYSIKGGGDSLVQAIAYGLYKDENRHEEVRKQVYEAVSKKPKKYGLSPDQTHTRAFKRLELEGEPLLIEHLSWISKIFNINILVHQGGTLPIKFKADSDITIHVINKDNVHFNGVTVKETKEEIILMEELQGWEELRISPNIKKEELLEWQEKDNVIYKLKEAKEKGKEIAGIDDNIRVWVKDWDKISIKEGLVVIKKIGASMRETLWVPLVPEKKVDGLIQEIHEGLKHVGRNKILGYMKTYFHFKNMSERIGEEIKKCLECKMFKDHLDQNKAPHGQIHTTEVFQLICTDLAEMPRSKSGHKYFMVIVDHYSKWAQAYALKDKEASSIASCLEKIFLPGLHTMPQQMLSDNGGEFKNRTVARVLEKYSIKQIFAPAKYPQNNGLAERTIGTIKSLLRTSGNHGEDWEQLLPSTVITYNNTYHDTIERCPAEVLFGRTVRITLPEKDLGKVKEYVPYEVGDRVLRKVEGAPKMGVKFKPGYVITRVNKGNKTYGVMREGEKMPTEIKCHHNQLRLMEKESGKVIEIEDDEVERLKYMANLTIRPNWQLGNNYGNQQKGEETSKYVSINSSNNSSRSNGFSGFEVSPLDKRSNNSGQQIELEGEKERGRKSVRAKKAPDFYQAGEQ